MLRLKRWLLFAILSCSLTSCTQSQPPDVYVFESLDQKVTMDPDTHHMLLTPSPTCMAQIQEPECGHGVSIISGKEIFVGELPAHRFNGKAWSAIIAESIYVPAVESYAPMSDYMINACKQAGCNNQVDAFRVKIGLLKTAITH